MLERNFSSILSPTKRMDLKIKRGFCSKSQEGSKQKPEVGGHSTFKVPGHKPTDWEKKVLMWSGRFKKVDDIPETVSLELIDAARNKLRVKMSYLMIAVTVLGCIVMVVEGKRKENFLHSKLRNHLGPERAGKLVFLFQIMNNQENEGEDK
ncbi:protein FAM162A isoform X1 [Gopherus flavomarginatus]|uniref:protein FAM162A isoform X1 n=1 Tax=Gopherus flavomarginatus TaxID=286002 RepID=UPI0021CC21EF|nr:protein FAM162A isoform X1 [Gopherus flavomarginatus]